MKKQGVVTVCAGFFALGLATTAEAAFVGRLPATPGETDYQAYYDDQLDITWLADADVFGATGWGSARGWAASLTINGVDGWRLPIADVNGDGTVIDCNGGGVSGCADNEMGYLFWEEGIAAASPDPFSDIQSGYYWSDTYLLDIPSRAWIFSFDDGSQLDVQKDFNFLLNYAWAVHDGDVGTQVIPVPTALPLFLSALGMAGIMAIRRRGKGLAEIRNSK